MADNYRELDDPYFDVDPVAQVRQRIKIDNDGVIHFQNVQKVDDTLDYAHESRGEFTRSQRMGDMLKVATVPMIVVHELMKHGIWQDPKRRAAWLNSPEGRVWKTRDIKL